METLKNPPKAILRKDYNDNIPKIVVHNDQVMRRSNRDFNMPPPGKPRALDSFLCPGSGEFDLFVSGVGKIEPVG